MSQNRRKFVRVSKQRQIKIPKEFYNALDLADEVLMEFNGNEIIIRPSDLEIVDFSDEILADLIEQGFEGRELLVQFKKVKAEIPNAIRRMADDTVNRTFTSSSDLDAYFDSLERNLEN